MAVPSEFKMPISRRDRQVLYCSIIYGYLWPLHIMHMNIFKVKSCSVLQEISKFSKTEGWISKCRVATYGPDTEMSLQVTKMYLCSFSPWNLALKISLQNLSPKKLNIASNYNIIFQQKYKKILYDQGQLLSMHFKIRRLDNFMWNSISS